MRSLLQKIHPFYRSWARWFGRAHLGLLAVAELLAFTPLRIISLVLVLFVLARTISFAKGAFTRFVAAWGFMTLAVIFIGVVAWLINVPLSSGIFLTIMVILLAGYQLWHTRRSGQTIYRAFEFTLHDTLSALLAVATMLLVLWPVIQLPESARLAQLITVGGDNNGHIEMVKITDLNQGFSYGDDNRVNARGGFTSYPQGWHLQVSFVKWLSEPLVDYTNMPGRVLFLFYAMASLWLGMLVFLLARLSFRLVELITNRRNRLATLGVLFVCAAVALHWLLGLFSYGFQAQVAAFVVILLELLLLAEAFVRKPAARFPLLLAATVAALGVVYLWLFMAPVSLGILGIAVLATFWTYRRWPPLYAIAGALFFAALAVVQVYIYQAYSLDSDNGQSLLLQHGTVQSTSLVTVIFLCLLAVGVAAAAWRQRAVRLMFAALIVSLLFALGLFTYHMIELGELRYFYFKATYMTIVLAALFVAGLAYGVLQAALRYGRGKTYRIILLSIAVVLGSMVCYQVRDPFTDAYANGTLSGVDVHQVWPLIHTVSESSDAGYHTIFIGNCNRGNDVRATQLAGALAYSDYEALEGRWSFDPGAHKEIHVYRSITKAVHESDRPIIVISGDQVVSSKLLDHLGKDADKINLVNYDTTAETEPISQCPDRIRDIEAFSL